MKTPIVSDELLAKFLDNKTSEEETEIVLKYINENIEHLDEFLTIRKASMLVDHKPCNVIENNPISDNNNYNSKQLILNKKKLSLWISVAASVLFIITISIFFVLKKPISESTEMAHNSKQDSTKNEKEQVQPIDSQKDNKNNSIDEAEQKSIEHQNSSNKGNDEVPVQIKNQNYANQQSVENKLLMIKPGKSPYSILCKNIEKQLNFEWEISNAKEIKITLLNSTRKEIVSHSDPNMKYYLIPLKNLNNEKTIIWELKVVFEDNTTQIKSGVIHITYQ